MQGFAATTLLWFLAGASGGDACPPSALLRGDSGLVSSVAAQLEEHGVATEPSACHAIPVTLERRHALLVVSIGVGDGTTVERVVSDARTAATLIESWVRVDVQAPLLVAHEAPPAPRDDARSVPVPAVVPVPGDTALAVAAPAAVEPGRGVQLFALAESALASDGTRWAGIDIGACVMLGPVCAAARVRFSVVVAGSEQWHYELDRRGTEMLLGADLPLRLGWATLSPGLAAGIGGTHTQDDHSPSTGDSGGLRAEAHATLSYPFSRRTALDVTISAEVNQATHVETSSSIPLPDEPWLLARLGAGVRFGGL